LYIKYALKTKKHGVINEVYFRVDSDFYGHFSIAHLRGNVGALIQRNKVLSHACYQCARMTHIIRLSKIILIFNSVFIFILFQIMSIIYHKVNRFNGYLSNRKKILNHINCREDFF